jgi:hypothetical protein
MFRTSRSGFAGLAALALGFTTAVVAAPVAIDSEQKANAAVVTALYVKQYPLNHLRNTSDVARRYAEEALQQLAATTTPAALINSRNGLVLPCANGGNLTARLARTFPRVLRLNWSTCKYDDVDVNPHERNGSGEVLLLSDSFSPDRVGAIRFGTARSDLVDTRLITYDDQITHEAISLNLRMVGVIPMKRAFPTYGLFIGEFAYETTGFFQNRSLIDLPGTGLPTYESTYRVAPEFLLVSGALTYTNSFTHYVDDVRFQFGKVTTTTTQGYGSSATPSIEYYTMEGLRIRSEADYAVLTVHDSIDGRIDYHYALPGPYTAGCLSGLYSFKTQAPIGRNVFGPLEFESGDLLINASTRVRFFTSTNVPPTLPVPQNGVLIRLDVANVGSFNYDTNGRNTLLTNSHCGL